MPNNEDEGSVVHEIDETEGKAIPREHVDAVTWTEEDAKQHLAAVRSRNSAPMAVDAFSPTPPQDDAQQEKHPEGKQMDPRPPIPPEISDLSGGDLWNEAEKLAEQRKSEYEQSQSGTVAVQADPEAQSSDETDSDQDSTYLGIPADDPAPAISVDTDSLRKTVKEELKDDLGLSWDRIASISEYLEKSDRVTLELQDGTFTMPIIDFVQMPYSVTLVLLLRDDMVTFVPKPGTEVRLTCQTLDETVYYPGAYAEIVPLQIAVMSFIRTTEAENGKA
jgi:hypothetical protein